MKSVLFKFQHLCYLILLAIVLKCTLHTPYNLPLGLTDYYTRHQVDKGHRSQVEHQTIKHMYCNKFFAGTRCFNLNLFCKLFKMHLYRTLLDRNDTGQSPRLTTGVQWASSSCMTSPMRSPSMLFRTGKETSLASKEFLSLHPSHQQAIVCKIKNKKYFGLVQQN